MSSLERLLQGHKITKCYIEGHYQEKKDSGPEIVLTDNFFYLSKTLGECFVYITIQGILVMVFSNNPEVFINPPEGSVLKKFSHCLKKVEDFGQRPAAIFRLIEKDSFSIKPKTFFVSGNLNVYMGCSYDSSINVQLSNRAIVRMTLGHGETHVDVSTNSVLKLQGVIKYLKIHRLEVGSSINLYDCTLDKTLGYEFGIPISDLVGSIIIHPKLSELRDAIAYEFFIRTLSERVETTRQRHVRTKMTVPSDPMAMVEVSSSDDRACGICCKYLANAEFDCGHVYMCLDCAERIRSQKYSNFSCPLCRKDIDFVSIVYPESHKIDKRVVPLSSSPSKTKRSKRQRIK